MAGGRLFDDSSPPSPAGPITGPPVTTPRVDTGPPDTARGRPHLRRWRWPALVVGLTAVVGLLLARRFYYGNDDLLEFTHARDHGLSWATLSQTVFLHFAPYNRLAHLLVLDGTGLSPRAGLGLVLVDLAAMLAACLWLMAELRVPPPRRALAVLLVALTVATSESAVWFDAGMHILPAIAVTLAVCAAHVRGVRTGRRRWHVVALVLFLLGQLTQERPVLALPLLVLVDLLLLWRDLPWRERVRRLWGLRGPIGALTVAALGVVLLLRVFVVTEYTSPGWVTTLRTMLSAFSDYLVPSLVNLPLGRAAGVVVELVVLAAVLVAGVVLARLRPGNAGPLLFCGAVFLLYYGFLKFSPLLGPHTITVNARRLDYAEYVLVPAFIALAMLRPPRSGTAPVRRPARRRALTVAGCLALGTYLLVTNSVYLDRQWSETTQARAWLDAVRAGADEWADPGVALVPLIGPRAMATDWSRPYAREDQLFSLIRPGFLPGIVDGPLVLVDDRGAVRPAALQVLRSPAVVVDGGCGTRNGAAFDKADVYFPAVRGTPLFVLLSYRASDDLEVKLSAGWGHGWTPNVLPTRLAAGTHQQLLAVDASRLQMADLQVLTSGAAGLCVRGASVVRPLLVDEEGARCREVDLHGAPGRMVPCP